MIRALVFVFAQVFILAKSISASMNEKRLQEDLIRDYNVLVRPVERNSDTLVVKFGIKLTQILDVEWIDLNLRWNPYEYENLTSISVPSSSIWIPDIVLFNSADGKYEVTLMTRATIHFNGSVIWQPPAIYKSSCMMNVEFFPFDVQHCALNFGSWTYDGQQVDLVHMSQAFDSHNVLSTEYIEYGMDLSEFSQSHEWDIMAVPAVRSVVRYPNSNEFYPDITFNITLKRKTLFYTCNLIIPCVSITFLTVFTFYLPSECGEKISLGTMILLSLTVFILLLNELIPPTSLVIPLIAKYLLFTLILVTLSNTVSIFVLDVYFRSPTTHEMPRWARTLFLNVMPRLLFMKRPPDTSTSISTSVYLKEVATLFMKKFQIETPKEELLEFEKKLRRANVYLKFKSNIEYLYYLDQMRAMRAVDDIVKHLREEDQENQIRQEWKFIALIIDRFFLLVFTLTCFIGSATIILHAPSLYDKSRPIDEIMSKHF